MNSRSGLVTTTLVAAMAMAITATITPGAAAQDADPTATRKAGEEAKPKTERPPIYDEAADARKQIAEALDRATRENRRVLIQWGANWCGWCHVLHDHFKTNRDVSRKLLYEYDVVLVDIGRWDKNMDLVEKYGAVLEGNGVPYLTVLDANGDVLANQPTGPLETEGDTPAHDGAKVLEFLTKHQAAYRPAERILQEGLGRADKESKKVFLHFGAPWCGWCHKLESWMSGPSVAKILETEFVDVKIDIDRTTGGNEMLTRYRKSDEGGIPWFAILRADGQVIATSTNAEGENLGCPWSQAEIAQFRFLLNRVSSRLSTDDIDLACSFLGDRK